MSWNECGDFLLLNKNHEHKHFTHFYRHVCALIQIFMMVSLVPVFCLHTHFTAFHRIMNVLVHCVHPEGLQPSATEASVEKANVKMNHVTLIV